MYNPPGGSAFEFLEITNLGSDEFNLSHASWSGIEYQFPENSIMPAGETWVLAADEDVSAFNSRYPNLEPFGHFSRNLSNGGERLTLRDITGRPIAWAEYDDRGFWPLGPDGEGFSLERHQLVDSTGPVAWRQSQAKNGSPGTTILVESPPAIRLNEIYAAGKADTVADPDWLELFNASDEAVDLSNWRLSDSSSNLERFLFPSETVLQPGGFLNIQFSSANTTPTGQLTAAFSLNASGETLFLFDSEGSPVDGIRFGQQIANYSLGRIDNHWTLTSPSRGTQNTKAETASVTDLRINEWQANEAENRPEFIELYNTNLDRPLDPTTICLGIGGLTELPPVETALTAFNSQWQIFKGTSEPTDPFRLWTQDSFSAAEWNQLPAPFHLGTEETRGTLLDDLTNNYSSVLMRRQFEISNRDSFKSFHIRVQADDGFIVWLNGSEWGRLNVPAGVLSVGASASNDEFGTKVDWDFEISNAAAFLNEGMNLVAMQAVAFGKDDDDFFADLSIVGVNPPEQAFAFQEASPLPPHSFLAPGGFLDFSSDGNAGSDELRFRLPAEGSTIALVDSEGNTIDLQTYQVSSEGISEGRYPDGSDQIVFFPDGPSPGLSNAADTDSDGIPDQREIELGLDPTNPADAQGDLDGDGASNGQEFQSGTDPKDATDFFFVRLGPRKDDGTLSLLVPRLANRSYTIEMTDDLLNGRWIPIADILQTTPATPGLETISIPQDAAQAFFRLISPPVAIEGNQLIAGQLPEASATHVPTGEPIELSLRSQLEPSSLGQDSLWTLTDSFDRSIPIEVHYEDLFSKIVIQPQLPLRNSTRYQVNVAPTVTTVAGQVLAELLTDWAFTTSESSPLIDDPSVYAQDDDGVLQIALEVEEGATSFTLQDVLADNNRDDAFEPYVRVKMTGDAFTPALPAANATLKARGATTRLVEQKSFRIALDNNEEPWRGHERINLLKHPFDLTRIRNRLSFELFRQIPDLTSLRTQFVHLFINGEDRGLFSQIEPYGRRFLRTHGLDPEGHLYKANFFEWFQYPNQLKHQDSLDYDREAFERVLEIETRDDHEKLLQLVADINDPNLNFETVFDQYFNRDNYLTWLAVNLLTGNIDTNSQNFLIYSPSDSQTWYFLPWDYDGAWGLRRQPDFSENVFARWQEGVATYWNVPLHRQFLMNSQNIEALNAKVTALRNAALSEENARAITQKHRDVIHRFISARPDVHRLPVTNDVEGDRDAIVGQWASEFDRLPDEIAFNYDLHQSTLERPMPIHLGNPEILSDSIRFPWSESHDLQGDPFHYEFAVSTDPDFSSDGVIDSQDNLEEEATTLNLTLPSGVYFYRVIIRETANPDTNWQIPFSSYFDPEEGKSYFGIRRFVIP